ncbi:Mur ligase family protein [Maritalea porphyrae]|uniref:Mur ligase central domain-containing protein n=1 Tax=Maritalea porphyrae TaxID=880732 RepID=A0ABQ5UQS1_9HYPH|nr:Mur ligase family protein [Maritalea porphyrae]GLQ17584.1 hypothetical protein GCM10007879_18330 [Maritalea porphyrae]
MLKQQFAAFAEALSEKLGPKWFRLVRPIERQRALRKLREKSPFLIGITGSSGKSTVSRLLGEILSEGYDRDVHLGHINNTERSVYRTLRKITRSNQTIVQEISAGGGPGYLDYLVDNIPLDVAVLTAIGSEHEEYFPSHDHIAVEKEKIVTALASGGIACLNVDDENVRKIAQTIRKDVRLISVSSKQEADVRAVVKTTNWKDRLSFDLEIAGARYFVQTRFVGTIVLPTILLVFAVLHGLGLPLEAAIRKLEEIEPIENRGDIGVAKSGHTFFLDSYKSPYWSTHAFFEDLPNLTEGKIVLVQGDVFFIGENEFQKHVELLEHALQTADLVIGTGSSFAAASKMQTEQGNNRIVACRTIDEVVECLRPHKDALIVLKSARKSKLWRAYQAFNEDVACKALTCMLKTECSRCTHLNG